MSWFITLSCGGCGRSFNGEGRRFARVYEIRAAATARGWSCGRRSGPTDLCPECKP